MKSDPTRLFRATDAQTLWLPWPPTVNTYWRHVSTPKGLRTLISRDGRAYRRAALQSLRFQRPRPYQPGDRLAVTIFVYPPDRRHRDLDNLLKAPLDCLQAGLVIPDDEQIDRLTIARSDPDPANPDGALRVDVASLKEVHS